MTGMFELFVDAKSYFRFRLTGPDGTVMATSKAFDDKAAAVAGIAAVREYAGMGLVTDQSSTSAAPVVTPGAPAISHGRSQQPHAYPRLTRALVSPGTA